MKNKISKRILSIIAISSIMFGVMVAPLSANSDNTYTQIAPSFYLGWVYAW